MAGLKQLSTEKRAKMFSQKEAEILSGFTRNQLRKLDESGLIVPARDAGIVYSWKQLIFLKILNKLRQDWTFKKLEQSFNDCNQDGSINQIADKIQDYLAVSLLIDKEGVVIFHAVKNNLQFDDEVETHKLRKNISAVLDGGKLDDKFLKVIAYIAEDTIDSKISVSRKTVVIIPQIIQELIELGKKLEIQNFETKAS
jgi:DNA-binding transcriptional MerR regulator